MTIELPKTKFPEQVVQDVVHAALRDQANLARLRAAQFASECRAFEDRFQMTTDEFTKKFDAGELGDEEAWFDWYASARGREIWNVKAEVMGEVVSGS